MRKLVIFITLCLLLAAFISAHKESVGNELQNSYEMVSLRTEHSESFYNQDGTRTTHVYVKRKYYRDGAEYKRANLAEEVEALNEFTHAVKAGPYVYRYDPDDKRKGLRFERKKYYVTYRPAGNWTGKTSEVKATEEGIKEIITLTSGSDSTVSWTVETNANVSFSNSVLTFKDSTGDFLFRVPSPWAIDAESNSIKFTTSYSHDILTYRLEIPEHVSWPLMIDPSTVIGETDNNTGHIQSLSTVNYVTARNATTGSAVQSSAILIGRKYDSAPWWKVYRSTLEFDTSSLPEDATIDSAKIKTVLEQKYISLSFYMYLVEGTFSGSLATDWFNDFDGWVSSGAYSPALLADSIPANHNVGDTLTFNLNSTGLTKISKTGNTKFMILSINDIDNASAPSGEDYIMLEDDSPYIKIWYRLPPVKSPTNFTMTAIDSMTIACSWTDESTNEEKYYIINKADSSIVDSLSANSTSDMISNLNLNTKYVWLVAADSSGVRGYSDPDSAYTLLPPPNPDKVKIMPVSSDTLRIAITSPANGTSGSTGMEVDAVSGYGATDSGWMNGIYSYRDGGLNPDSTYVYRLRLRNGEGIATVWTPNFTYHMNGLDTLTVYLSGDSFDDYNVNFGDGRRDSTYVRVGASDTGERLDGFVSFSLPWHVMNGGVDSLFLSMTRADEKNTTTPSVKLYGIPVTYGLPIEERILSQEDSTAAKATWTISSGTGTRKSPNLRTIFREWQDIASLRDFAYDFGLRLDDNSQASGTRAVFLDASHPSYNNDTRLTIYYTPGHSDTLEGAPGNFLLSVLAPDSLHATWTDNSESEYGFVILNLSDSTIAAGTDTLPHNTTSFDAGGLTPNTVYEWFVRALTAEDHASSGSDSAQTFSRVPGITTVSAISGYSLNFIIDPLDNPGYTQFAVQDSISGLYVDGSAEPDTLRAGPPGEWGWRTYEQWGSAPGDTLTGLTPNTLYVLRAKARSNE